MTGASGGIGAATARRLHAAGYDLVLGARRLSALEQLVAELGSGARGERLDVADPESVASFCAAVPRCALLVNNAGVGLGDGPIAELGEAAWRQCFATNVTGVVRMTRALLPALSASGAGLVVTIGSVAAFSPYANAGPYVASKHAVRAVMDVLRLELLGSELRLCEIDPGMVETEFSVVRFGDRSRARAMYEGMTPLRGEDVADCIAFVAGLPSHVNVDRLVVRPRDQATPTLVHRRAGGSEGGDL